MFQHFLGFLVAGTMLITAVVGKAEWHAAADGTNYLIDPYARVTWYSALVGCAARNLSLVSISSEAKHVALEDVLRVAGNGTDFWIGGVGSSVSDADGFYWTPTGNQFDYTYWKEGYPIKYDFKECVNIEANNLNYTKEGCVAPYEDCIQIEANDYVWVNNDCDSNNFGLLCEESSSPLENCKKTDIYGVQVMVSLLKDAKQAIDKLAVSAMALI